MQRFFLTASALFALLFLAACQPAEDARTVTATGEGEISVPPEVATVNMSIEARDADIPAAQQQAVEVVEAVLQITAELGVAAESVQTTQLQVHPEFDWQEGRQQLRGYLVRREIRIELEDLAKLGPLLERSLRAGVNNISPPALDVKDPRALHREVLARAAADARANAEVMARTLAATLGPARHVSAVDGGVPEPMQVMEFRQATDAGAEQGYTAGRITVRARVQAVFDLDR